MSGSSNSCRRDLQGNLRIQRCRTTARQMVGVLLALAAFVFVTACETRLGSPSESTDDEAARVRLQQIRTELAEASAGSRERAPAASFVLQPPEGRIGDGGAAAAAGCLKLIVAGIRAQQGRTCVPGDPNQALAEIGGFSNRCIDGDCDPALRLQEANDAAARTCRSYCSQFSCAAQYSPRAQCAAQECRTPDSECPNPQCPTYDACFLLQAQSVWNCECVPRVEE